MENGEILYYYIEKDKAVISSYNFFSGNKKIIGEINNYYLDSGSAVLLDENVYFFAAVIEDKKVKNELFRIDIKEKTIDKYEKKEDNSLPGLSIQQIEKKLITLKNEREGDEIITYLEVFDPKTGIWEKVDEKKYNERTHKGSALYTMCTDEKFVYVIEDDYGEGGEFESFFIQYDRKFKEHKRILLDGEVREFLMSGKGRIIEMKVWDEQIFYIKNLSSYGFLGHIGENKITKISEEREFLAAESLYVNDNPILYVRGSNYCYVVDSETGDMERNSISFESDDIVLILLSTPEKIVIVTYTYMNEYPQKEILINRNQLNKLVL